MDIISKQPNLEPFKLFGSAHIITVVVMLLFFSYMIHLCKYEKFRKVFKVSMLIGLIVLDVSFRLWSGFYQTSDFIGMFSVHISSASIVLSIWLLISYNQKVMDVLFYWGLIMVPQAIITPGIYRYGFPHLRFFHIFLIHFMVLFTVIYYMKVEKKRLSKPHLKYVIIMTHLYAFGVFVVNMIFSTNYMFIGRKTNLPSLINYLGEWPYYIISLDVIMILLFVVLNKLYLRYERNNNESI